MMKTIAIFLCLGLVAGLAVDVTMALAVTHGWLAESSTIWMYGPAVLGAAPAFTAALRSSGLLVSFASAFSYTIGSTLASNDGSTFPLNFLMIFGSARYVAGITLATLLVASVLGLLLRSLILRRIIH